MGKDIDGRMHQDAVRQALCLIRRLYGSTPAEEFSPKRLKAVRQAMIDHRVIRKVKVRDPISGKVEKDPITGEVKTEERVLRQGLARKFINNQIDRIKRMFAWAVQEELVPVAAHQALLRVTGLRKGKTKAWEKPRVKPVPRAIIDQTMPHLPAVVRTMVEVQYLGNMRPQEVIVMRAIDIDMTGPVWEYRPHRYKTEHHNEADDPDRERIIFLGPRAQELVRPFLTLNVTDYLFAPDRSEKERRAERRRNRKTPLWPSHVRHQEKKRQGRSAQVLHHRYDVAAYRRAIRRACQKAGVPIWAPNRLRHSRSTDIRKRYGLEASKACAGHREIGVTQHYAEQDQELARRVMAEIGWDGT